MKQRTYRAGQWSVLARPESRRLFSLSALTVALAAAQTQAADTEPEGLEEIIVTANRREQSVLDVPYNISAVTGRQIDEAGITDLQGLTSKLPGVIAPDLGPRANSTNSQIIIRGLNTSDQSLSYVAPNLSAPLVSTYIDDTPLFVNLNLTDIDRVEVLRGPQGTLYGSGAVGGTIRLIHNLPDFSHTSGNVFVDGSTTRGGDGGNASIGGLINLPVSDNLAVRISAGYERQAGFINANNTVVFDKAGRPVPADPDDLVGSGLTFSQNNGIDRSHSTYSRVSVLWEPLPAFRALLTYQMQRDFSNGFSAQTPGKHDELDFYIPNDPMHRQVDVAAVTLTRDFGFATLTSTTSYSRNDYQDVVDLTPVIEGLNTTPYYYGGYPRATSPIYTTSRDRSVSEELRLVSKTGELFDYVVGAFFHHQNTFVTDPETIPGFGQWSDLPGSANALNDALGTPGAYANFGDYVQSYYGGPRPSQVTPNDLIFNFTRWTGFTDRALYSEVTWHPTSRWQITGGGRVFWQDFSQNIVEILPVCATFCDDAAHAGDPLGTNTGAARQSFQSETFKLNAAYELTANNRLYATVSQGFRHGGANAFPIGNCLYCEPDASLVPYHSDRAVNSELGYKGEVFNRLRITTAIYQIDWRNIQLETFDPLTSDALVINGDRARSRGLELEISAQLAAGWSTTFGYGYTDSKLVSDFTRGQFVGFNGDRLPGVPRNQLTLALDDNQTLIGTDVFFHLDASYRSVVTTAINDALATADGVIHNATRANYHELAGFAMFNGSVGAQLGNVRARLYCNNITNQEGITGMRTRYGVPSTGDFEYLSRPRTIGINLQYTFGR